MILLIISGGCLRKEGTGIECSESRHAPRKLRHWLNPPPPLLREAVPRRGSCSNYRGRPQGRWAEGWHHRPERGLLPFLPRLTPGGGPQRPTLLPQGPPLILGVEFCVGSCNSLALRQTLLTQAGNVWILKEPHRSKRTGVFRPSQRRSGEHAVDLLEQEGHKLQLPSPKFPVFLLYFLCISVARRTPGPIHSALGRRGPGAHAPGSLSPHPEAHQPVSPPPSQAPDGPALQQGVRGSAPCGSRGDPSS